MTGILLAGGIGCRLLPFSKMINKHLLPVYNKPMIYYPFQFLKLSGISEIIIVVNEDKQAEQISQYLSYEGNLGFSSVKYVFQDSPKGTAHAISLCKNLLISSPFVVIWGDNMFEYCQLNLKRLCPDSIKLFIKEVDDVSHYGDVIINANREISNIIYGSKMKQKIKKGFALTGLFVLNSTFFKYIDKIKPNAKNEIDIVDALRLYIEVHRTEATIVEGFWIDMASSYDNLLAAACFVKKHGVNKLIDKK